MEIKIMTPWCRAKKEDVEFLTKFVDENKNTPGFDAVFIGMEYILKAGGDVGFLGDVPADGVYIGVNGGVFYKIFFISELSGYEKIEKTLTPLSYAQIGSIRDVELLIEKDHLEQNEMDVWSKSEAGQIWDKKNSESESVKMNPPSELQPTNQTKTNPINPIPPTDETGDKSNGDKKD